MRKDCFRPPPLGEKVGGGDEVGSRGRGGSMHSSIMGILFKHVDKKSNVTGGRKKVGQGGGMGRR